MGLVRDPIRFVDTVERHKRSNFIEHELVEGEGNKNKVIKYTISRNLLLGKTTQKRKQNLQYFDRNTKECLKYVNQS